MSGQVMFVVAFDSQLKWAMSLAAAFASRGWSFQVVVPTDVRHSLSPAQVSASGAPALQLLPWAGVLARARSVDCVVLALQGTLVSRFTDELELLRRQASTAGAAGTGGTPREPVVVSGWVGIIIEKLVAGYLDRAGADVVAVNSMSNLTEFARAGHWLGVPSGNLLLSGLPLLPARPGTPAGGEVRTLLFADQPTVPGSPWDRAYLYQRLIDYARAHPDREVLLKPRHRPGEGTFHVMQDHPEAQLARLGTLPENLAVTYASIAELLPRTDLLVTMSSTAALEAIGEGVRVAFLSDLGIHEKHGNQVLVTSGLFATFDDLIADRLPVADPAWLADVFVGGDERPADRIVARVVELAALPAAERPGRHALEGRYLSGRIAIRERRATMPAPARDVAAGPSGRLVPLLRPLARRGDHALRAVLPAAWHRAALARWRRLAAG